MNGFGSEWKHRSLILARMGRQARFSNGFALIVRVASNPGAMRGFEAPTDKNAGGAVPPAL
jgi:hypothetical protein